MDRLARHDPSAGRGRGAEKRRKHVHQFFVHARLAHVVDGAGGADLEHPLVVVVPADRDHGQARPFDLELAGRLDAIHLRHLDVHHDSIDVQARGELHGLPAVAGPPRHAEPAVCCQNGLECRRKALVVFGDEDAIDLLTPQELRSG
jgi:hypothetical protein